MKKVNRVVDRCSIASRLARYISLDACICIYIYRESFFLFFFFPSDDAVPILELRVARGIAKALFRSHSHATSAVPHEPGFPAVENLGQPLRASLSIQPFCSLYSRETRLLTEGDTRYFPFDISSGIANLL